MAPAAAQARHAGGDLDTGIMALPVEAAAGTAADSDMPVKLNSQAGARGTPAGPARTVTRDYGSP